MHKKDYLNFSQKILKTQLEKIRQNHFMSPKAWEEYYQKNKKILCDKPDPLLISEILLLGKKFPNHFSSVLDLGCGAAANSLFLARQGWKVVAVDTSKTAIQRLQKQAKQENLPLTAQQTDAVNFSSEEEFDCVLICDLHLASSQRKKIFQNSLKLLKKKGVLLYFSLIESPNGNSDIFPSLERLLLDFPKEFKITTAEELTRCVFLGHNLRTGQESLPQSVLKGEGIKIKAQLSL